MRFANQFCSLIAGICVLLQSGCRPSGDAPPLARISGVVLLDGQPLTHGSVQFTPDRARGTSGRMALGKIGPDGHFTMTTQSEGDGVQVGFHKVGIQCFEQAANGQSEAGGPPPKPPKSLVPEKYTDPETSGLTIEVHAGSNQDALFELKSTP